MPAPRDAATGLCLVVLLLQQPCFASEPLPDSGDTAADKVQERIAVGVADAAAWLDAFLADENYEAETNTSSLRLRLKSFSESGEGTDFKARTRLNLSLPGLENRLRLSISGATEDFDTTDSDWEDIEEDVRGTDENNLGAWLTYFFRQTDRRSVSLSGGVKFRSGDPDFYIRPRYRYLRRFPVWDLRFIQRASWYTDTGLDARSELQLERLLGEHWFFRTTAQLDWYEEEDGLYPQLRFAWRRALSERRVLALQWNNYFETRPSGVLDSTVFRVWYRQQAWRSWLFFAVAPQLVFPRDEDYAAVPGIMLEVEAHFRRER